MGFAMVCEQDNDLAVARSNVYVYLSAAFSVPPTAAGLPSGSFREEVEDAFGAGVADAYVLCLSSMHDSSAWEEEAKREFMSLLKVPGPKYVSPYESVYADSREIEGKKVSGLLMGQSAVDVQKWYRLAALDISDEFKDLPDHIALEFAYIAHLCEKEREFAEACDEAHLQRAREMQRDFLAAHPVRWVDRFCDRVLEHSNNPYFKAIARLAGSFVKDDLAQLENLLGPSAGHSAPCYGPCDTSREADEPAL